MSAYPYNPEGNKSECIVHNEQCDISIFYNKYKCIIPKYAPFFRNSIVVKEKLSGKTLYEGLDYYVGHKFVDASYQSGFEVFGSIMMIDTSFNKDLVFESYATLGGGYNINYNSILEYLSKDFDDPRNCSWTDVSRHTIPVPPKYVPSSLADAIAHDPVTGKLDKVKHALATKQVEAVKKYKAFNEKLNAIQAQIESWDIENHPKDHGPVHHETYTQLGALGINDDSKDSLTAYGKTLAELTTLINKLGVEQADIDKYVLRSNPELFGDLELNATSAILHNKDGKTTIDLRTGDIAIHVNKTIDIVCDAKKGGNVYAQLEAGLNYLNITSAGHEIGYRPLTYNGYFIVTVGNVADFMPSLDIDNVTLTTTPSSTVDLVGQGTKSVPLIGTVKMPIATASVAGKVSVTNTLVLDSDSVALSSVATHQLNIRISNMLKKSQTLNGVALNQESITIGTAAFNVEHVSNTRDTELANSSAFTARLGQYSNSNHTHIRTDGPVITNATLAVRGLMRLIADPTFTNVTDAADCRALFDISSNVSSALTNIDIAMPANMINLTAWGDCTGYVLSFANKTIKFPKTSVVYNGKVYYIAETTVDLRTHMSHSSFIAGKTVYFAVYQEGDHYIYGTGCQHPFTDADKLNNYIYIGSIKFTDAHITAIAEDNIENVYSLPASSDMLRHFDDINAHGLVNGQVTLASVGLDELDPTQLLTPTDAYSVINGTAAKGLITNRLFDQICELHGETVITQGIVKNPSEFRIPIPAGYSHFQCSFIACISKIDSRGGVLQRMKSHMNLVGPVPQIFGCAGILPDGIHHVGDGFNLAPADRRGDIYIKYVIIATK